MGMRFILVAAFLSGALQAQATTYDYIGQPFTTFANVTYAGGYSYGEAADRVRGHRVCEVAAH